MWSKDYDKCVICGTTERRHWGHGLCKNCYVKLNRKQNPETEKEIKNRYRNSEKGKETEKKYMSTEKYKQSLAIRTKKYRESHKELCLERTREWRLNNPDKLKEYEYKVRKKMDKLKRYGPDAIRLIEEIGFICQKCGSTKRIAIHHIDWNPENNTYENFTVLCGKCHAKIHWWIPMRLRRELFNEWMSIPLEETDGEIRVRNLRFPEKYS